MVHPYLLVAFVLLSSVPNIKVNGWNMDRINPSQTNTSSAAGPSAAPDFYRVATNIKGELLRVAEDGTLIIKEGANIASYTRDGVFRWRIENALNGNVRDAATGTSAVYLSSPDMLMAFDLQTGNPVWPEPAQLGPGTDQSSLVIGPDGTIYADTYDALGTSAARLTAVEPSGNRKWQYERILPQRPGRLILSGDGNSLFLEQSTPAGPETVLLNSDSGQIVGRQEGTSSSLPRLFAPWNILLSGESEIAAVFDAGIVIRETPVDANSKIFSAVDRGGTVLWTSEASYSYGFGDSAGQFFAVSADGKQITAIRGSDGAILWKHAFEAPVSGLRLANDGALYLISGGDLIRTSAVGIANDTAPHSSRAKENGQSVQLQSTAGTATTSVTSTAGLLASAVVTAQALMSAPGLTAGYAFDEASGTVASDASGNSLSGTLTNGPVWTAGKYGNAIGLDGVNDFVDLGNPAALQITGSLTISAWINSSTFPADDAAIVSKRAGTEVGFQLDTTKDRGTRTIGFKLTNSSGSYMIRYGATTLQTNTWYHVAGVYNAAAGTMDVYLNGIPDNGFLLGTVTSTQQNSTFNVNIGRRPGKSGFQFAGLVDDVRIYSRALTQAEVQSDMNSPLLGTAPPSDTTPPTVSITAPASGATVSGTGVTVSASATDNTAVAGVQFLLDGANLGAEDTAAPYSIVWNTTATASGSHVLSARARDSSGNVASSANISVTVSNTQPPPPSTITAAYGLNEGTGTTASDASGNGLNGTLVNGPVWTPGRYGNAVKFDGIDDYIDLGNPAALQMTGSMTISAWINSSSFPADDAGIVSKRAATESGFQLDTTKDRGPRTIGFKLTSNSGANMIRYGATTLQTNVWYHVAGVYNAATLTMDVYLNGQPDNGVLLGTVTAAQQNSAVNVTIGRRSGKTGFQFAGMADEVRIYARALTQSEIQADMNTGIGGAAPPADATPPQVSITAPANNAQLSGIVAISANATDNIGVAGVQFQLDGINLGLESVTAPYGYSWDTRTISNGTHFLTARARDAAGNTSVSSSVTVNVLNTAVAGTFQNEILITGFNLPTCMKFLPDGRMLIGELGGTIWIVRPGATQPDPTPFLRMTNVGTTNSQQGLMDFVLDPNFSTNGYFYVFYTTLTPNRDRVSRFQAVGSTTALSTEFVVWADPDLANAEHHGGALNFGNDGKLYITTGEHFIPQLSQDLTSCRGKILRVNSDGTIPTDNPFYDGAGPNLDSIWAYGLRNPYRAFIDPVTGRYYIGDVGGNVNTTSQEEVNLGQRGANYGWPNCEGVCTNPAVTNPIYSYPHNGRDASVTGGFVYRGSQFPAEYYGSYFFADYAQNWIRRLTFDANGNVTGIFNFEPPDGTLDGPYGDIVYLREGPDGALYYIDLGWSDVTGLVGVSKIRRIRYISGSNQPPVAAASATPASGAVPLTVAFSSAGSLDPEGAAITYLWDFGNGATSTAANPTYVYTTAGTFNARLTVSDGVNSTVATPITIRAGNPPVPTISSPKNLATFKAGDVITFSGDATDIEDGVLPASAFSWQINFLHNNHVHPVLPQTGIKSGTFTIATTGHDYSGDTRYEIILTVTDSSGLQSQQSVLIYPQKVNLTFNTSPSGLTLYLDGVAMTAPFVYDTLIGFNHTIEARNQLLGATTYNFGSWSDGGAQQHVIVVPAAAQSYLATFTAAGAATGPLARWSFDEGAGTTASDGSGYGNTATLTNGAGWTPGVYGSAVSFDGINDFLSVPNSASLDLSGNALTMTMWLNPQPLASGDSVILGKFWTTAMTSPYYQYGLELAGGNRPALYVGTSTGVLSASSGTTIPFGVWTHLAVVFDGTQVRFYQNGVLTTTRTMTGSIQARGMPLNVGADIRPAQFQKGAIDELRIYGRALTATDVQTDMNNGLP